MALEAAGGATSEIAVRVRRPGPADGGYSPRKGFAIHSHSPQPPGAPRRGVATIEVGGEQAELQVRGGRYLLAGAKGSNQELTEAEADQLSRHADDLTARAAARGILLDDSPAPAGSWLDGLRRTLPRDRLAVLVDTTTIHNARDALQTRGRAPSPVGLLDLSVLTAAATLFDTIVIQPERFPPLREIRDLTEVLQPGFDGQRELERIYGEVWEELSRPQELAVYARRWGEFLDITRGEPRIDVDSVATLNAELSYDFSSSADIAEAFGSRGQSGEGDGRLAVALGIHTIRTRFNDAVAAALGLPYLATSVRLPVSSHLADRKTQLLWVLRRLIASSSPPARPEPATFAPRVQIAAPLLLGLVLERMSRPEDYRSALDDVRQTFGPLRARLRDDRENALWDEKPQLYLERFGKHLAGTGATVAGVQDAAIGAAQAGVTIATGDPGFATAALKAIAAVKPLELAHRAYLRLWRPEVYVLLNVAQEAKRLSLLDRRVERIWGSGLDRRQQHLLERFASLHAGPFLTPTTLT